MIHLPHVQIVSTVVNGDHLTNKCDAGYNRKCPHHAASDNTQCPILRRKIDQKVSLIAVTSQPLSIGHINARSLQAKLLDVQ